MAQYINKNALVAEIGRRKEINKYRDTPDGLFEDKVILSFIDTLEVKEDNLLTEKKIEKELAEDYISIFDKKFGNKLPNLKGKKLAEFKNFINTCEQTFSMKYFDCHATQGKLFEKLALLWAVWGKKCLSLEVKEMDLYNNGWIDCTKQMPPETKQTSDTLQGHKEWTESDMVLVWDSMYGCGVGATRNGKWMSEQRCGYAGQVVHGIIAWRPIPEFNEELLIKAQKGE